ncbi:MAG: hypothetical protein HC915_19570 [Anaerolineae bacterium]|nr:hypothetical protein [Anaerolineae bacterium]
MLSVRTRSHVGLVTASELHDFTGDSYFEGLEPGTQYYYSVEPEVHRNQRAAELPNRLPPTRGRWPG